MTSEVFLKDLAATLYSFQRENILCDTVLIADDCQIWAHSVILAAASPYIYTHFLLITGHKAKYRFSLKLSGCDSVSVKTVLCFLYTGSLIVPSCFQHPDDFSGIVNVCEKMGIDIAKLNGAAVKFTDTCNLETFSDQSEVYKKSMENNTKFDSCLEEDEKVPKSSCQELTDMDSASLMCGNTFTERQDDVTEHICAVSTKERFSVDGINQEMCMIDPTSNCDGCSRMEDTAAENLHMKANTTPSANSVMMPVQILPPFKPPKTAYMAEQQAGFWVSVLKSGKSAAIQHSTALRVAAKILNNITVKKTQAADISPEIKQNEDDNIQDNLGNSSYTVSNQQEMLCPTCGEKFNLPSLFQKHLSDHKGDLTLTCKVCGKVFTCMRRLQAHKKLHTGDRPHVCSTCGKTYRFRSSLVQHSHVHLEKRPYLCDTCGAGFALAVNLRRHTMSRHSNVRPFVCKECGRGFVRDYLLRQHMENHTGKKSNICPRCGMAFSHRGNLNRHLRNHDGEKHHVCAVCGKAFNRKSNMEKHVLSHTRRSCILTHQRALQHHTCPHCQKVFRSAKMLNRHASVHLTEKSHKCDICAKQFTTSRYLQQHVVVHQEKCYKCDFCAKMFASEHLRLGHTKKCHQDCASSV